MQFRKLRKGLKLYNSNIKDNSLEKNTLRTRTITWINPIRNSRNAIETSGLDYLKSIKNGYIDPPPVALLVGYKISYVDNGHTIFELDPKEYHYNPFSTVHGGIISTLLDTSMTAAVLSALPKGFNCTTVELKINFIRPANSKTGILECEAFPIHIGARLATSEGRIKDCNGKIYAHGVSTCSIFKNKSG